MATKPQRIINPVIWKDTGEIFEGHKIYMSILGHYAFSVDGELLKPLPNGVLDKIKEKKI